MLGLRVSVNNRRQPRHVQQQGIETGAYADTKRMRDNRQVLCEHVQAAARVEECHPSNARVPGHLQSRGETMRS